MNIRFLLYVEINLLCIILLLIMLFMAQKYGIDSTRKRQTLSASMMFAALMNLSSVFWHAAALKIIDASVALFYVLNAAYFIFLALSSYCWFLYEETSYDFDTCNSVRLIALTSLPLVVLVILLALTPYNGWLCHINDDGTLKLGPVHFLQQLLSFGYVVIAAIRVFFRTVTNKKGVRREQYFTLLMFAVPPIICLPLQFVFVDLPVISVSFTVSFLLVYTDSLRQQSSLDPLTGVGNRRMLVSELSKRLKIQKKDKDLYFLFMDIDSFKYLNDTYGHHYGDKVLQVVADCLRTVCNETDGFCCRYGGDEFALIQELDKNESVASFVTRIKSEIKSRSDAENFIEPVSVSVGFAVHDGNNEDVQSFIDFADRQMYAKKEKKHADAPDEDADWRTGKKIYKRLFERKYCGVIYIDVATRKVHKLNANVAGALGKIARFDAPYDEQVFRLIDDSIPRAQTEKLKRAMAFDTIVEKLETEKKYEVDFQTEGKNDLYLFHRITYEYPDVAKTAILVTSEDVSELITSEIDPPTGLLNLTGFYNRLNERRKTYPNEKFRIQTYEVEHFKDVVGVYGNTVGNALLRDIGAYMKEKDDDTSFSAHISSDHFARYCVEGSTAVEEYRSSFIKAFADYKLSIPVTIHVGVYDLCRPEDDASAMIYKANLALETIKGDMNNTIAYYEDDMMKTERERLELLKSVDDAIANEDFEVWFQPQVDYAKRQLIGAEALIRWRHPVKGLIPPSAFIPLLEKSNYIGAVDELVIKQTCRYIRKWLDRNPSVNARVSVNLSRNDVLSNEFLQKAVDIAAEYNVPKTALRFEVTESAYMDKTDLLIAGVDKLRKEGFLVELDDFGAGDSSLNTLKDISVDTIKLDMQFLSDSKNFDKEKIIVSTIIDMSEKLGLPVIAEGVETKAQADMLSELGCNRMQGYYFSKPVPAEKYEKMLFGKTRIPNL